MQRRESLTLLAAVITLTSVAAHAESLSLRGRWRFQIDPNDQGGEQRWYRETFEDDITLPGTMGEYGKGNENENRRFTTHLSQCWTYAGKAWYQRDIEIPSGWEDRHVTLRLERSKLTSAWLDDQWLGDNDSLGCEQVYDLTGKVQAGRHRLTICVDNKTVPGNGGGHQITDHTQTNWNGIIGVIELRATAPVWIERVLVYPNVKDRSVRVKLTVGNVTGEDSEGQLSLQATCDADGDRHKVESRSYGVQVRTSEHTAEYEYILGKDALLWDEFTPHLYTLTCHLTAGSCQDTRVVQFGLREFRTKGTQFTINGRTTFLRGKHDAMVWPLLGHPSMKVEDWVRVLKIAKSYGINHYRFHTCTPPEAAFAAADVVGIYMQPELYNFGGNLAGKPAAIQYNIDEGMRILKAYGNHPSFVMFALGNEMGGGRETRADIVRRLRSFDGTRLYAQASNYDFWDLRWEPEDDYWTTVRTAPTAAAAVRGSFSHADLPLGHIQNVPPSTRYDYSEAIANVPAPVIGHEVGQFQVFPNFDEIAKYTGVQKPWNLEVFAERLKRAGVYDQWPDFFRASGALSVICYREDIEAAIRTPGFGGFQLLDLQDFPGQGTALVGILDAFMDSKGLITPEHWRQFCSEVVPLVRMDKYTWQSGEDFRTRFQVANYGPGDLTGKTVVLTLAGRDARELLSRTWSPNILKQGQVTDLDTVQFGLPTLDRAEKLTLTLAIPGMPYRNDYPLWVYPRENQPQPSNAIRVRRQMDVDTLKLLGQGQKVLLLPLLDDLPDSIEGFFASDFWCYPMFYNIAKNAKKDPAPGTLGLLCDPNHPLFREFPTESHSNWQWWHLVMNSRAIILDATPAGYRPIVQVIDNFDRNHKLGTVFECAVGRGKLLVCAIDLPNLLDKPEARQFYRSLLAYMESESFDPQVSLEPETVVGLFKSEEEKANPTETIDYGEFFSNEQ